MSVILSSREVDAVRRVFPDATVAVGLGVDGRSIIIDIETTTADSRRVRQSTAVDISALASGNIDYPKYAVRQMVRRLADSLYEGIK